MLRAGSIWKKNDMIRIAIRTKIIDDTIGKHLWTLRIMINLVQILVIINVGGNNVIIKQHINNLKFELLPFVSIRRKTDNRTVSYYKKTV